MIDYIYRIFDEESDFEAILKILSQIGSKKGPLMRFLDLKGLYTHLMHLKMLRIEHFQMPLYS